jgi:hypothetical protein
LFFEISADAPISATVLGANSACASDEGCGFFTRYRNVTK